MSSNPKLFKSSSMEILTPEEDFIDGATQLDSREDNKNSKSTMLSIISGCNIGSKTLLAELGKLSLKFTCPAGTSTCLTTLFNKGELLADWGELGSCSACPNIVFLPNSLETCNGASGYVARCHF